MIKTTGDGGGRKASRSRKSQRTESQENENPLEEAFLDEVADIHNAEQQLIKALPAMAKAAQSDALRDAIEEHLEQTREQAQRIEEALQSIGKPLKRKKCKGMEGLIAEGKEMLQEYKDEPAIDAVIISAAQKVEHYEIASYGTLCTWAKQMGYRDALDLLKNNLNEEKSADEKLTAIAKEIANTQAYHAQSE